MNDPGETLTIHVPLTIRRRGGRKQIVSPAGSAPWTPTRSHIDSTMVKALARAFRWRRMLEAGAVGTVREIAAKEKINGSHVSRVLRLTLLAPAIVEAILDGRQSAGGVAHGDGVRQALRLSHKNETTCQAGETSNPCAGGAQGV